MKKTATLLAAAIVPLVAGLGIATSSQAQDDQAYCRALVDAYTHGGQEAGFAPQSLDTTVAISQCRDGNPQAAIPVLERELRRNDFALPPRG